jgi:Protein of unknown function (DUF4031)
MAVYVDDMNMQADVKDENTGKSYNRRWSHLFADTHEELMAAAQKIGLNPRWLQHPGTPMEHFDVTTGKRNLALAKGVAKPVGLEFTGEFITSRRHSADKVLVVTGPRKGVSKGIVEAGLKRYFRPDVTLVVGGAGGVDTDAAELWREWGGKVAEYEVTDAEWKAKPQTAGFDRNGRMVARAKRAGHARVLAFDLPCNKDGCTRREPHNTHGTSHCAENAEKAGLKTEHYPGACSPGEPCRVPSCGACYPEQYMEDREPKSEPDAEKALADAGMLHPDQPDPKHPHSRGGIAPEGSWQPPKDPITGQWATTYHAPCPDCGDPTVIGTPGEEPTTCTGCRADAIAMAPRAESQQVSRPQPPPEHFPKAPDPGFTGPVHTSAEWEALSRQTDKEAGQ